MTGTIRAPVAEEAPRRAEPEAPDVRRGGSADEEARDAFALAHPEATVFHLCAWQRLVQRVHGHDARDLVATRNGEVVGILPMSLCKGLRRSNLVSMPYAVYGGPVAADEPARRALIAAAEEMARGERVGHLELRCAEDPDLAWASSELYCTFVRELPERVEGVLAGMPKKARAEARKGRKQHGLELVEGEWYIDDLARLFLRNKHQLGSPALPLRHFHALLEELGARTFVHLVRAGREPVAAVLSFSFRGRLTAYYAGSAPGADRALSASNFMYMALQEWAVQRGFREFDFCRSRVDSGAFSFKKHQGFEPRPLHYRYLLVRDRRVPSFTPSNPRTRLLRSTWSRLPLWVVRHASDRLARYLY